MAQNCQQVTKDDDWPCACTKHNRQKQLTQIKLHHPDQIRCKVCKAERPEDWRQHVRTLNPQP